LRVPTIIHQSSEAPIRSPPYFLLPPTSHESAGNSAHLSEAIGLAYLDIPQSSDFAPGDIFPGLRSWISYALQLHRADSGWRCFCWLILHRFKGEALIHYEGLSIRLLFAPTVSLRTIRQNLTAADEFLCHVKAMSTPTENRLCLFKRGEE
jgi:hypothetical protein